ncbi:amelotin [Fukomys damarensis]|uniref:amelotin n=1 Tax=Fukomys damarensis TaxID=885580 RepID=UPI00053F3011|nr:amelotin [Fukomys damarensis]
MKTLILLFCLLGSTRSLPKQLNSALEASPTKPAPDQVTTVTQQQPSQVFPSLSLIPLTQLLTLGSDLQLLTPAPGAAPGAQKLPLTLGALNGQNQLQQVLPIFVTQVGAQATMLSSEELPLGSQFFTGLLLHTLFPGGILPTSQVGANPDAQDGALPVGQAGANANIQATPEGHLSTPGVTDDDFEATTPAGIQRATHTTKGITTGSPNGEFSPAWKVALP